MSNFMNNCLKAYNKFTSTIKIKDVVLTVLKHLIKIELN